MIALSAVRGEGVGDVALCEKALALGLAAGAAQAQVWRMGRDVCCCCCRRAAESR